MSDLEAQMRSAWACVSAIRGALARRVASERIVITIAEFEAFAELPGIQRPVARFVRKQARELWNEVGKQLAEGVA